MFSLNSLLLNQDLDFLSSVVVLKGPMCPLHQERRLYRPGRYRVLLGRKVKSLVDIVLSRINFLCDIPIERLGHSGTLTTTLAQSSDSTKVTFSLEGVPKGLEDEINRNLEGY